MTENAGMYQNYSVEGEIKLKGEEMMNHYEMYGSCMTPPVACPPIYECPRERCVHREIMHEVPHIVPINTRVINHHIYRHTYQPMYTCTTEDQVCNVGERPCGL